MLKLKNILIEYLQTDEMYLYKYFKNYKENLFYIIAEDYFKSLIEVLNENIEDDEIQRIYDNELYDDHEYIEDFVEYVLSNEELKKQVFLLIDSNMSQFSAEYNDIDSNDATLLCMEYEGIYKKNWIIHFTSAENAQYITKDGFTYGTSDVERLGLTTWYKKEAKKYGGFNFGYNINTYKRYYRDSGWGNTFKYGDSCIMAMVSGIRVEHYGDQEEQIIFWGKSASSILMIYDSDAYDSDTYGSELKGDYYVENYKTGKAIYSGDFEDVVDWVVKNHLQYKNVLYRGK